MYIKTMDDAAIDGLRRGLRRLHDLDKEWDEFGLIESVHEDDPRENDENWVDDRLHMVHAVYFRKRRDIVVWLISDIRTSNMTAKINAVTQRSLKKWWKFWK